MSGIVGLFGVSFGVLDLVLGGLWTKIKRRQEFCLQ